MKKGNVFHIFLYVIILFYTIPATGQITLISERNTPRADYLYIYQKVRFNFSNALADGPFVLWNFGFIELEEDTFCQYFTKHPYYNSFPGHDYQLNLNENHLKSEKIIYKITEDAYSYAYTLVEYEGYPDYLDTTPSVIIPFPLSYGTYLYGNSHSYDRWSKTDAWGNIHTDDSLITGLLRIASYSSWHIQTGSHTGEGGTSTRFKWYTQNSELPLFIMTLSMHYYGGFGFPDITYDSTCWVLRERIYSPYQYGPDTLSHCNSMGVFPVPADQNLQLFSEKEIHSAEIKSINGKTIFSDGAMLSNNCYYDIPVGFLPSGVYFLSVEADAHCVVKFIKQ